MKSKPAERVQGTAKLDSCTNHCLTGREAARKLKLVA